jgi:hypothetical protein
LKPKALMAKKDEYTPEIVQIPEYVDNQIREFN